MCIGVCPGDNYSTLPCKSNSSFSTEDIIWFSQNKYTLYIAHMKTVQIGNCQIWGKIMKIVSNRVHMARFGPIIAQNRSHRLWGASGMPPGPQNLPKKPKTLGLGGLGVQGVRPPYFPCVGKLELLLQGVVAMGACLAVRACLTFE